ncbi:hypothetical protein MIND_00621500 [Mycena indigotica]|uniref:Uncharacterized protein n=1 Tax=Mycena indigotica TaxID=2126181 RepID=A0A8H6SU10_9AGAR|nr:uncharacterized protein MIND_00621500 [Mycena indigotica]KAF7303910.1 hypothetical protein MIND_00621500 [Mycena indigotica]
MKAILGLVAAATAAQAARFVNASIDDTSPQIVYTQQPFIRCTPSTCGSDSTARLFNGTSTTTSGMIIIPFVGNAVYVYLGVEGTINFNLDGVLHGVLTGSDSNDVSLAFYEPGLTNSKHVLTIYPSTSAGSEIVQFDYILYAHQLPSKHIGAIVGGVVGGLAFMAILGKTALWLMRRRRQRRLSIRGVRLGDDWPDKPSLQLDGVLPQKPKQAM